jgi:hypothetical protein
MDPTKEQMEIEEPALELKRVVRRSGLHASEEYETIRISLAHVEAIQEVGDKQRALFLMTSGREILVDEPYVLVCSLIDGTLPDPDAADSPA